MTDDRVSEVVTITFKSDHGDVSCFYTTRIYDITNPKEREFRIDHKLPGFYKDVEWALKDVATTGKRGENI